MPSIGPLKEAFRRPQLPADTRAEVIPQRNDPTPPAISAGGRSEVV